MKDRPKCFLFNMRRGTYPIIHIENLSEQLPSMTDPFNLSSARNSNDNSMCCALKINNGDVYTVEEEIAEVWDKSKSGLNILN